MRRFERKRNFMPNKIKVLMVCHGNIWTITRKPWFSGVSEDWKRFLPKIYQSCLTEKLTLNEQNIMGPSKEKSAQWADFLCQKLCIFGDGLLVQGSVKLNTKIEKFTHNTCENVCENIDYSILSVIIKYKHRNELGVRDFKNGSWWIRGY